MKLFRSEWNKKRRKLVRSRVVVPDSSPIGGVFAGTNVKEVRLTHDDGTRTYYERPRK